VTTPSALPSFLKLLWVCVSPIATAFAGRILWEKTVWTWSRGPQMVGFSLWHIYPGLAVVGTLFSLALIVWLLPAVPYAIVRREELSIVDVGMIAWAMFVAAAIVVPDNFFA